jgi:hypothetical protein
MQEGQLVTHKLHGACKVLDLAFTSEGLLEGVYLQPVTQQGKDSLKQAALNSKGHFFESNENLIAGDK